MWIVFALSASLINAFYFLCMQNIKINAHIFMVYRGLIVTVILLPILIFYPVKYSPTFYLMSVLQGCIVAYTDYLAFKANQTYGSETVSSILPLSVILVFILWCFINPSTVLTYLENPLKTLCIIASLLGVIIALIKYQKTPLTKKAFIHLTPVLFLSALISILNKLIMSYSGDNPLLCACWRVFILSVIIAFIHFNMYKAKHLPFKALIDAKTLIKGSIFVLLILVLILKSLAMLYTQNPAYVSCITYLAPVWIMLLSYQFNILTFKKNHWQISKKYELLLIASIIVLVVLTH